MSHKARLLLEGSSREGAPWEPCPVGNSEYGTRGGLRLSRRSPRNGRGLPASTAITQSGHAVRTAVRDDVGGCRVSSYWHRARAPTRPSSRGFRPSGAGCPTGIWRRAGWWMTLLAGTGGVGGNESVGMVIFRHFTAGSLPQEKRPAQGARPPPEALCSSRAFARADAQSKVPDNTGSTGRTGQELLRRLETWQSGLFRRGGPSIGRCARSPPGPLMPSGLSRWSASLRREASRFYRDPDEARPGRVELDSPETPTA